MTPDGTTLRTARGKRRQSVAKRTAFWLLQQKYQASTKFPFCAEMATSPIFGTILIKSISYLLRQKPRGKTLQASAFDVQGFNTHTQANYSKNRGRCCTIIICFNTLTETTQLWVLERLLCTLIYAVEELQLGTCMQAATPNGTNTLSFFQNWLCFPLRWLTSTCVSWDVAPAWN